MAVYSAPHDILACLDEVEALLKHFALWQRDPPTPQQLCSKLPFCTDTLTPEQWLQWIFLPRMRQMVQQDLALPEPLILEPYFAVMLDDTHPAKRALLRVLQRLENVMRQN